MASRPIQNRPVTWQSDAPAVATIDDAGVVRAVGPGTATVTATIDGVSGSTTIIVLPPIAALSITPPINDLYVGQSTTLTAHNAIGAVSWSSDRPEIASIDPAMGLVFARAVGDAVITASAQGPQQPAIALVRVGPVPPASVVLSQAEVSLVVGETRELSADVTDAAGRPLEGRLITWVSSNTAVAVVAPGSGQMTAVSGISPGEATVTATSEGKSDSARVTVTVPPVATVQVDPPVLRLGTGNTAYLSVTLRDADGNVLSGRVVTWKSVHPIIAAVSPSGEVTGISAGRTGVEAASEGKADTSVIEVSSTSPENQPPIAVANGPYTGVVGVPLQVDRYGTQDPDGNIQQIVWDFGDGSETVTLPRGAQDPQHTYLAAGLYTLTLIVTDAEGLADTATTEATITDPNRPPVPEANGPYSGVVGVPLQVDRNGTEDPDENIETIVWDWGDGTAPDTIPRGAFDPQHTYAAAGVYTLTLTVIDSEGLEGQDTAVATITESGS